MQQSLRIQTSSRRYRLWAILCPRPRVSSDGDSRPKEEMQGKAHERNPAHDCLEHPAIDRLPLDDASRLPN